MRESAPWPCSWSSCGCDPWREPTSHILLDAGLNWLASDTLQAQVFERADLRPAGSISVDGQFRFESGLRRCIGHAGLRSDRSSSPSRRILSLTTCANPELFFQRLEKRSEVDLPLYFSNLNAVMPRCANSASKKIPSLDPRPKASASQKSDWVRSPAGHSSDFQNYSRATFPTSPCHKWSLCILTASWGN